MELFGTIAAGLLVSVATSVVTVRLALGRFYSERWWERRLDAYIRVHDALSAQLRQREAKVDDLYAFYAGEASNGPLPDDMAEEIRRSWRESERELESALARGAFLLSEDAVALLRRYQRQQGELERTMQDLVEEQIEAQHEAARDAVNKLGKLAKRDLGIAPFELPWRRKMPVKPESGVASLLMPSGARALRDLKPNPESAFP